MATTVYKLGEKPNPFPKDPNAILDYSEDWTAWLLEVIDTISNAVIIFSDPACTLSEDRPLVNNGLIVTAWLEGGRPGVTESATFRITTAGGRVDDRTIYFKIKDR